MTTQDENILCDKCDSRDVIKAGMARSHRTMTQAQQYICKACGNKMTSKHREPLQKPLQLSRTKKAVMRAKLKEFEYTDQPIPETNWTALTKAQNQEKESLFNIMHELLSQVEIRYPQGKKGRKFIDVKDMVFCLVEKTYTKLSSRRLDSDLREAQANEYITKVPHFTTLMNFLEKQELTPLLQELIKISALPVKSLETQFAVDSSGFSSSQFDRWFDYKYGQMTRGRSWIKAHIMCGTQTNIITSVELTNSLGADYPQLIPLVKKTTENFNVQEVSADKAYQGRTNFEIIHNSGAIPFIPFKSNTLRRQKGCLIWSKCFDFFHKNPQIYLQHYHRRSNVETCFSMVKQKFGKDLMSKNFTSQCNEVLLKILCHNICCLIQEFYENNIETYYSTETQKIKIQSF